MSRRIFQKNESTPFWRPINCFTEYFAPSPVALPLWIIVTAVLVFFLPHMLISLSPVSESYKQALLVQHPDTADKLSGSDIVEFFDHPAFL